ncbi:MAG: DUF4838 domain-containing protein [Planctomycetia bacterium]|nr:DUF4838 domain-containing protein [Planctomycetia bacterium]
MRSIGFVLLICLGNLPLMADGTLSTEGKTSWKIVLPDSPTEVEKTASKELADHLNQATGAEFPVVSEKDAPETNGIFLGNTSAGKKLLGNRPFAFDEIRIRTEGGNLYLTGHERRGTLYAVYSFLQDVVGILWLDPDRTFVPKKPTLVVPECDISYTPPMFSREMYHRRAQPTVFSARMKGNGFVTEPYGGRISILHFVHSFYRYLPPAEYFEKHPEWYSEIKGVRTAEHGQLCLTNDAMREELTRKVLETLRKNPGAKIIDISQNDWHGYCQCEKCRALDEREESHAGTLVAFLNRVAEDVEKEFPDVLVESLAYQYTRKPPKTLRPRDNVLIRLCTIECSYIQPLDGPQNREFAADMEGWSQIAKHLFIWDYVTNYTNYIAPFPNLEVLPQNMRYFVQHGAIGLFEEGEGDDFCELKNWMLMRLMWDPSLDEKQLFTQFCDAYYGREITPLLRQYWDVLVQRAKASGVYLGCFGVQSQNWLDLETLNQATRIFNDAMAKSEALYGKDSPAFQALRKAKMGIDYVWIQRYFALKSQARREKKPFEGPKDLGGMVADFIERCERFKTQSLAISQQSKLREQLEAMRSYDAVRRNPPEGCQNLEPDAWFAVDDALFANFKDVAQRVDDPASVDGKATRMTTRVDWNTSYTPTVQGKYRLLVSMRADAELEKGLAGNLGVYNSREKKGVMSHPLPVEELKGEEYRWIDCGVVDFQPGCYIWFAHRHNPQVEALYVDRLILMEAE